MHDLPNLLHQIAVWAIPVLFAVTVHEVAHGYVARLYGDDTAERQGRLSLNPLSHVDLIGTVLVPALLVLFKSPYLFGWAKPVPVNFSRLYAPRRDMAKVAAAGPAANFAMAVIWISLLWLYQALGSPQGGWTLFREMCVGGTVINVVLMVLNLLPLPPLDGGRIAVSLLPARFAIPLSRLEPWGIPILLLLIFTGALGHLLFWPFILTQMLLYGSFGIDLNGL